MPEPKKQKERRKQLERVKENVSKYVACHDKIHPGSRNSVEVDAGAQKRPRRDGSAPTNIPAHIWFSDPDNADAASKIERVLPGLRHSDENDDETQKVNGHSLYWHLCIAGLGGAYGVDFAEFRRWQQEETRDAKAHHKAYQAAIDMLARMLILDCEHRGENPEIRVHAKGDDGKSDEPASTPKEADIRHRKTTAEDSYRVLAPMVTSKMNEGYSKRAAVDKVAEEQMTSPARIWRALKQVEKESA